MFYSQGRSLSILVPLHFKINLPHNYKRKDCRQSLDLHALGRNFCFNLVTPFYDVEIILKTAFFPFFFFPRMSSVGDVLISGIHIFHPCWTFNHSVQTWTEFLSGTY